MGRGIGKGNAKVGQREKQVGEEKKRAGMEKVKKEERIEEKDRGNKRSKTDREKE